MGGSSRPDGIERKHIHEASGSALRRGPFGLAGLAIVLAPAFFGVYGGSGVLLADAAGGVRLEAEGPGRIRNGEFFELVVTVEAQREVRDLVVLIGAGVLRETTVNTLLPEPSEHGFRDGSYELRFGPLAAGESLAMKLDAQINPSHSPFVNEGRIAAADGESVLAKVFYEMEVLP